MENEKNNVYLDLVWTYTGGITAMYFYKSSDLGLKVSKSLTIIRFGHLALFFIYQLGLKPEIHSNIKVW